MQLYGWKESPGLDITNELAAQGLWQGRLCTASASSIMLWEHLITFGDEVRLIWKSHWSAGKILFLLSRYYNIFTIVFNTCILYSATLSVRLCFAWLRWQAVSGIFVYGITEIILMLRLYAMFAKSKKLLALIIPGFSAVIIAEIVILVLSTRAQIGPVNADPHAIISMEACILTDTWRLSYLYWIPFLSFETFLFTLALVKGYQSYFNHELSFKGSMAVKALEVLIRDSILYFMLIFAVYLTNTLAWVIDGGRIGEIPVAFCVAVSTVMAQRLLLNIRSNFEKRQAGGVYAGDESDSFRMSTLVCDDIIASEAGEPRTSNVGMNTMVSETTAVGGTSMYAVSYGAGPSTSPVSPISYEDLK